MKKKFAAFVLCVICLLSAAGCGQTKTDEQTPPAADQSTTTDDYLTGIGGTYVELFPELSKSEYRNIWIDATAPLVGAENAEATTDLLLGMCMAEPYGPEAAEKYEADPDSMAFNCYFLGGIDKFVMDGHTITGLDAQGQEVFSHTYKLLDEKNENGFIFYQSEDENSGEFTYFAFVFNFYQHGNGAVYGLQNLFERRNTFVGAAETQFAQFIFGQIGDISVVGRHAL